jgi:Tol biopolymer transport system component
MTDRELEQRLRARYAAEVPETESAPEQLREALAAIPRTFPAPLRPVSRRRGFTLLAVAAVLLVGGAMAAGSGLLRFTTVTPPVPSNALLTTTEPTPTDTGDVTPVPTPNVRPGGLIAFNRSVEKARSCSSIRKTATCPTARVWVTGTDGGGARELRTDGVENQTLLGWSSDGTRLLYAEGSELFVADLNGGQPQVVDTGCAVPATSPATPLSCLGDSQASLSSDGRGIIFVREVADDTGYAGPSFIATMDLESGRVALLNATSIGSAHPDWSPDRQRIVFYQWGTKDTGGPDALNPALYVIDADGRNLRQVTPATLAAQEPEWSPDGARIVFVSPNRGDPANELSWDFGDIYTIRPDGSDVRRLTTGEASANPSWTADGRILFARASGAAAGWWTMNADGSDPALLVSAAAIGVEPSGIDGTHPAWQPIGGSAIVPPPWTPATAITVGPPAPTPSPTPTPDLAPGFSWAGTTATKASSPLGETATLLVDGRVLITESCGTDAELYDPATGTFSPTGSLSVVRGGKAATLLLDGRVLFTGGSNCGAGGSDGDWASAELYDPATGTFSPTGSMAAPRDSHTSTLLADGRVLIAGGMSLPSPATAGGVIPASYRTADVDHFLATAEVYDPTTGKFSKTGSMSSPHRGHTATLLQDGRVLVVGNGGESSPSGRIADLYDPATGKFTVTGSLKSGRWLHTATLLQDGRVLILGGRSPNDSVRATAELYDPRSGAFSSAGSMGEGRQQHTATLLPDGRVLIAAGYWQSTNKWRVLSSTEMYDPRTGNFSPLGSMGTPREGHTATLLADGRVLFIGGTDIGSSGGDGVTAAVVYQP